MMKILSFGSLIEGIVGNLLGSINYPKNPIICGKTINKSACHHLKRMKHGLDDSEKKKKKDVMRRNFLKHNPKCRLFNLPILLTLCSG